VAVTQRLQETVQAERSNRNFRKGGKIESTTV
jgi:hypothetical protein